MRRALLWLASLACGLTSPTASASLGLTLLGDLNYPTPTLTGSAVGSTGRLGTGAGLQLGVNLSPVLKLQLQQLFESYTLGSNALQNLAIGVGPALSVSTVTDLRLGIEYDYFHTRPATIRPSAFGVYVGAQIFLWLGKTVALSFSPQYTFSFSNIHATGTIKPHTARILIGLHFGNPTRPGYARGGGGRKR